MSTGPSSGISTPRIPPSEDSPHVPRVTVQLVPSSDVSCGFSFTVRNLRIHKSAGSVYIKANLRDKKCRNQDEWNIVESVISPVRIEIGRQKLKNFPTISFTTELRSLSPYADIEICIHEYFARAVVLDHSTGFLGSVSVPVFMPRGLLLRGHHLFFFDKLFGADKSIEYQFHVAALTENEADSGVTEWNLPIVTTESILDSIPESKFFITADFSLAEKIEGSVYYCDSFKPVTSGSLLRMNSSGITSSSSVRQSVPKSTQEEPPSVLANWMTINGPIHTSQVSRTSKIPGTGFIPVSDIASAICPSPVQIVDYELFKDHPAAIKAHKIHRQNGLRVPRTKPTGGARPSADEMSRLNDIVSQPVRALSDTERELLVKHIWSLTDKKNALLKVLLALMSTFTEETPEGILELVENLLVAWTPIDVDVALSLLGEEIGLSLFSKIVRSHAVARLQEIASNHEINLFLYQLVQSLRYEDPHEGPLGRFLIDKATRDEQLATLFFWYLECESSDEDSGALSNGLARLFGTSPSPGLEDQVSSGGGFSAISAREKFSIIRRDFWRELGKSDGGKRIRIRIETQCKFRERMLTTARLVKSVARTSVPVVATTSTVASGIIDASSVSTKTEIFRETLHGVTQETGDNPIARIDLTLQLNFPTLGSSGMDIPIPLNPRLTLVRVDEKKSFCIKSAKYPFVLSCEVFNEDTQKNEFRKFMFKAGDDLRQDQLVIQFVQLIDELLKKYGLDLKLSPYKVLATSVEDGFIEFVSDSQTLSSILANNNNDLMAFFRSVRPRPECPYGVDPIVLDTFARSCAGYCAITYILGIGDRHMDNLLVTSEGKLFHVDFGYILGRDPKPFPPPMKLCREMVEGMGGTNSMYYKSFVSKCTQAFLILRRHANLLITLLYLAANSNIKDMREQDPALAIMKVQKRLMPEVNDEVAEQNMIDLINESTNALFPVVFEKLHKWAVYWRQ